MDPSEGATMRARVQLAPEIWVLNMVYLLQKIRNSELLSFIHPPEMVTRWCLRSLEQLPRFSLAPGGRSSPRCDPEVLQQHVTGRATPTSMSRGDLCDVGWSKEWLFIVYDTSCWFQTFFIFTTIWGRFPIWLIFFRWVETTNRLFIVYDRYDLMYYIMMNVWFWFISIS